MSNIGPVALGINTGTVREASADGRKKKELPACAGDFSYTLLFNYICPFQGISPKPLVT